MSTFKRKKIQQSSRVCLRLKEIREQLGFTIDGMAKKTRLSKKYIIALEACEFDVLPKGKIYQKNFIKTYLSALGVNPTPYIQQFVREETLTEEENNSVHPHTPYSRLRFQNIPALLRYSSIALTVFILVGYLGFQIHRILEPPSLTLASPINGAITTDAAISVRGLAESANHITINGKLIAHTEEGQFEEMIDLSEGVNEIKINVQKKHGKTTSETRYVTRRIIPKVAQETRAALQS